MFDDAYAKARELEAEKGLVFVHPFDDPRDHRRRGHGRARNARGRARPRHAGRADRRRRADVAASRSPPRRINPDIEIDRRRGRALSVDEECRRGRQRRDRRRHAGRGHRGQGAGRAHLADHQGAGQRRSSSSPSATSSTRWRCWSAIEKTVVEGAGAAGLAALLADPDRFRGKQGRHHPVRRQYRHAPARQCAGARPRPLRPHRAAADRRAGPARRAGRDHRQIPRSAASTSSRSTTSRIFTRLPAKDTVIEVECEARDSRRRSTLVAAELGSGRISTVERRRRSIRPASRPFELSLRGTIPRVNPHFAEHQLFSSAFTSRIKTFVTIVGGRAAGERTISLPQILRDQPDAVPLSSGQGRAEGVHRAEWPQRQRTERGARPHRLPPQPVGRLPPELHRLLRLRLGARRSPTNSTPSAHPAQADAPPRRSRSHAPASRGRPRSNMRCCAAISRSVTPAAAWPKWTSSDFADMVEQTPVRTYVIEYREPSVDGRPGQAGRRLPVRPAGATACR